MVVGGEAGVQFSTEIGGLQSASTSLTSAAEVETLQTDESTIVVGVPTLIAEILSPNDRHGDIAEKVQTYLEAGVKHVWVVDPDLKSVRVYRPNAERREVGAKGLLTAEPDMPGLRIDLSGFSDHSSLLRHTLAPYHSPSRTTVARRSLPCSFRSQSFCFPPATTGRSSYTMAAFRRAASADDVERNRTCEVEDADPRQGVASPVVWKNQVWVATATEDGKRLSVVCVDKDYGMIVHDLKVFDVSDPEFCHPTNSYASCTPAIEEGRIYVHTAATGRRASTPRPARLCGSAATCRANHFRGPGSSPILFVGKL